MMNPETIYLNTKYSPEDQSNYRLNQIIQRLF